MTGNRWKRRALVVLVLSILFGALMHAPVVNALVVPTIAGVMILLLVVRLLFGEGDPHNQYILKWTMFSFIAHLVAGLLIQNTAIFAYLGGDAFAYHTGASAIVEQWTRGIPNPYELNAGKSGFYYLLAGVYWIFGSYTSAGIALNATIAAALIPVVVDSSRRLFGDSTVRYIPPMLVFFPGLFIWTSQLLKEGSIVLLVALAANAAVRLTERISIPALAGLALPLAVLFTFRAWVGLMIAAGVVAALPLCTGHALRGLGTAVGALSALAVVVALGVGYAGYREASGADLEEAQRVRQGLMFGASSGFAAEADVSTARGALSFLPQGFVQFTLGPFPWSISGARQLPALADAVTWWVMLPSLWFGWRAARRVSGRRRLILMMPTLAVTAMLSLAIGNFGTVVRERQQVVILVVPFFALGLAQRRAARDEAREAAALARNGTRSILPATLKRSPRIAEI